MELSLSVKVRIEKKIRKMFVGKTGTGMLSTERSARNVKHGNVQHENVQHTE
jgi:hypothetical protein